MDKKNLKSKIFLIPVKLFPAALAGFFLLMPFVSNAQKTTGSSFQSELIFPQQQQHAHSSSIVELPNGDLLTC